jgi:hypothetical protein
MTGGLLPSQFTLNWTYNVMRRVFDTSIREANVSFGELVGSGLGTGQNGLPPEDWSESCLPISEFGYIRVTDYLPCLPLSGNAAGGGLSKQERMEYNQWKPEYWKARA